MSKKDREKDHQSRALYPWQAVSDWGRRERQMERMFDEFLERRTGRSGNGLRPALDLYEQQNELVAKIELPGLEKDNIAVRINDHTLTVEAEKQKDQDIKDEHYHRVERFHGSLRRTIDLPAGINADQVRARFENGVLEIRMPRSAAEDNKANRIAID